jgi:hypothetical protein
MIRRSMGDRDGSGRVEADRLACPADPDGGWLDLRFDRPHPARVYDFLLGGKDNFAADREAAAAGLKVNPNLRIPPRENRAFLRRAVAYLAREAGVSQFLDIGAGIPTSPNVHQVAQGIDPRARIVYVDNDPIVLAHARALLTSCPAGKTAFVNADVRDPDAILGSAEVRGTLDLSQPVAVLLLAILHFVPDDGDPAGIVRRLMAGLPSGSYLALSHLTGDFDPRFWEGAAAVYGRDGVIMQVRSKPDIERFFDGLELVEPGVVSGPGWRPDFSDLGEAGRPTDAQVSGYCGVARKP